MQMSFIIYEGRVGGTALMKSWHCQSGMGWDGIYCGYGVATALRFVHWSTPSKPFRHSSAPSMGHFVSL